MFEWPNGDPMFPPGNPSPAGQLLASDQIMIMPPTYPTFPVPGVMSPATQVAAMQAELSNTATVLATYASTALALSTATTNANNAEQSMIADENTLTNKLNSFNTFIAPLTKPYNLTAAQQAQLDTLIADVIVASFNKSAAVIAYGSAEKARQQAENTFNNAAGAVSNSTARLGAIWANVPSKFPPVFYIKPL